MKICEIDKNLLLEKYSNNYDKIIKKIKNGYPVQYAIGDVSFCGYKIIVNKNVLIPRPETEFLVEKTLKLLNKTSKYKIVDLGTGSGCIAIALKKELPNSEIMAIDISRKALSVAKKNSELNKTEIRFMQKDITKPIKGKFDVIISNPPYIGFDEQISASVYKYEPHLALFSKNPTYFYEQIIKNSVNHLNKHGVIAFEIGYTQNETIVYYAKKYFPKSKIISEKDYSNRDRYVFIINE